MDIVSKILLKFSFLFAILYSYHFIYQIVPFIKKPKEIQATQKQNKIAVMIAARNEEVVISDLLESLNNQTYQNFDTYVIADNCSDNTAQIAKENGAMVIERFNKVKVGKGYALDTLLNKIFLNKGKHAYEDRKSVV